MVLRSQGKLFSIPKYSGFWFNNLNTHLIENISGCCNSLDGFYQGSVVLIQECHS